METSFHGDNAVFMYLGDWERGLNFDWSGAYEYLRKNAMDPKGPRGYLAEYMQQGWISDFIPKGNPSPPYAGGKAGAATTLEYSWDDYALALYAKSLARPMTTLCFFNAHTITGTSSTPPSASSVDVPRMASGSLRSIRRSPTTTS
jgi:putative alpha-1,2-mannosidase